MQSVEVLGFMFLAGILFGLFIGKVSEYIREENDTKRFFYKIDSLIFLLLSAATVFAIYLTGVWG
jgi:NhaP-type Na+/H+ or K+/H+ antiporter